MSPEPESEPEPELGRGRHRMSTADWLSQSRDDAHAIAVKLGDVNVDEDEDRTLSMQERSHPRPRSDSASFAPTPSGWLLASQDGVRELVERLLDDEAAARMLAQQRWRKAGVAVTAITGLLPGTPHSLREFPEAKSETAASQIAGEDELTDNETHWQLEAMGEAGGATVARDYVEETEELGADGLVMHQSQRKIVVNIKRLKPPLAAGGDDDKQASKDDGESEEGGEGEEEGSRARPSDR